jgi:aryl-alcohol dehydrogenase-like predicted oxidoreductase
MPQDFDTSRVALGTAGLAGLWGAVDRKASVRAIHMALDAGIRHIDTAPAYADAEALVGEALRSWTGPRPTLSTKAGKGRADSPDGVVRCYTPEAIRSSVHDSLRTLGVDTLDVLFLHDPPLMRDEEIDPAVETFARLRDEGLVRLAGIGGNHGKAFAHKATRPPFSCFMGFNRYNLLNRSAAGEEFPTLREAGMSIWQASPLYMGLLGARHRDYLQGRPEWIPAADLDRARDAAAFCAREGVDMPGLALQFVYASPWVDRIVIGASTPAELQSTLAHLRDPLLADMAARMHAGGDLF